MRRPYPVPLAHHVEHCPDAVIRIGSVGTSYAYGAQDAHERCQLKVAKVTRRGTVQQAEDGRDAESLPITTRQETEIRVALKELRRSITRG
jgi:hypothetical protein